jgi:hypothetical protein
VTGRLTSSWWGWDSTVIPVAHSGFTQVIAIAIAEKIAERLAPNL